MPNDDLWWVYVIECRNGAYYTGVSADVSARYALHCAGHAARYTWLHQVRRLVGAYPVGTRSQAMRVEKQLKNMPAERRVEWIETRAVPVVLRHADPRRKRKRAKPSAEPQPGYIASLVTNRLRSLQDDLFAEPPWV